MLKTLTLVWFLFPIGAFAQSAHIFVSANNIAYGQNTDGRIFNNADGSGPGFEAPAGSGIYAIYNAGPWFGGIAPNQSVVSSSQGYCDESCVYGPGPLKADGSLQSTPEAQQAFNRFWTVTADQVAYHELYFDCVYDPQCNPTISFPGGYVIPPDFITWPAEGNTDEGFAQYLAPFIDYNSDGIYNPDQGDYPNICGDVAIYSIMNDNPEQGEGRAGIELHTMTYTYNSSDAALFNTVFVNQRIINRSSLTYSDAYLGVWNDFDLGNYTDDYLGTDVERSMVFVYNGNNFDSSFDASAGYLDDLGVVGMRILGGAVADANGLDDATQVEGFTTYGNQTSGWGDGIADNERLGLSYSMSRYNTGSGFPFATDDPQSVVGQYFALIGLWADGSSQVHEGIGYNPNMFPFTPSKYAYPGDSDPLLQGTFGTDPNYPAAGGWAESNANNAPGDRKMIASSGPFTFAPGDMQYLDYAYIFARDSHEPGVDVLETLRSYADAIVGTECGPLPQIITGTRQLKNDNSYLRLLPNPASNNVMIETAISAGRFSVMDMIGRLVLQGNITTSRTEIDLQGLTAGIYLVKVEGEGSVAVKKLVVKQ